VFGTPETARPAGLQRSRNFLFREARIAQNRRRITFVRTVYNILFFIGFWLSAPYYFIRMRRRGNWQNGFPQRFGRFDAKVKQSLSNRHVIWMHAVSVGEVNVCTQLIRALEPRLPNVKIMVSTTTTTGMGELEQRLPHHIGKFYYPIDRKKYVSRSLNTISPDAVVLVEAEIWPNFIWRLRDRKIPTFLVNARLSERSYRGYKRFGFLFRPLFAAFTGIGAQNEADAARLRELGCRPEAVHVVGSLKFDAAKLDEHRRLDVPDLLEQFGVPESARLLVAGSTHAGEESILAEAYLHLKKQFPDLFLILVPRHFERCRDVGRELQARGLRFAYRSEVRATTRHEENSLDCLIVNTTGELRYFYEHASVIFVGKSLTATGGQNPIEPGALAKPMIFGPNMQNFADVVKQFLENDAAWQVKDAAELEHALARLLSDEARREELGRNALKVVHENQGAILRTVDMIIKQLDGDEIYIAPLGK
jgi:3-deoxy-D-manno-octulosonic-acid transferase